jgi:hypothetical protein
MTIQVLGESSLHVMSDMGEFVCPHDSVVVEEVELDPIYPDQVMVITEKVTYCAQCGEQMGE